MRTEATGVKDNSATTATVDSIEYYDEETGFKAMEKWTGWHASILAIQIAKGLVARGTVSIENAISGTDFLKEAEKRNFDIKITIN